MAPSAVTPEPVEADIQARNTTGKALERLKEPPALGSPDKDLESHLDPFYKIVEQPIGTRRPIRVACLGAGYSGLMMSIIFSQKMQEKNADLVVYERNTNLGGTWFENRWVIVRN